MIASRHADSAAEVHLPELVSVIDRDIDGDGDLILEGYKLAGISGVDGAKIIVGESTEIIIKNPQAQSFAFRAIQFKK